MAVYCLSLAPDLELVFTRDVFYLWSFQFPSIPKVTKNNQIPVICLKAASTIWLTVGFEELTR